MDTHTVHWLMAFVTALLVTGGASQTTQLTPTGGPGHDLTGKMFTLSSYDGRVGFYPPSVPQSGSKHNSHPSYPPTSYPSWTTASPSTAGVSVCVRFMAELRSDYTTIFTLSPSSSPMALSLYRTNSYRLTFNSDTVSLVPNFNMSPPAGSGWTSVCVMLDGTKNLVQIFTDSSMSIRKFLSSRYVWSGEPMIQFSGFDGQLTDVQVWDYPLSYREIFYYMNFYRVRGSVLRWSSIGFFLQGKALLEDDFHPFRRGPIGKKQKGGRGEKRRARGQLTETKKPLKFFLEGKSEKKKKTAF